MSGGLSKWTQCLIHMMDTAIKQLIKVQHICMIANKDDTISITSCDRLLYWNLVWSLMSQTVLTGLVLYCMWKCIRRMVITNALQKGKLRQKRNGQDKQGKCVIVSVHPQHPCIHSFGGPCSHAMFIWWSKPCRPIGKNGGGVTSEICWRTF